MEQVRYKFNKEKTLNVILYIAQKIQRRDFHKIFKLLYFTDREFLKEYGMRRLMDEHDRLYPNSPIAIRPWRKESHDRWLIADDCLYHCGHSLNATGGHKLSAITLMGTSPEAILAEME